MGTPDSVRTHLPAAWCHLSDLVLAIFVVITDRTLGRLQRGLEVDGVLPDESDRTVLAGQGYCDLHTGLLVHHLREEIVSKVIQRRSQRVAILCRTSRAERQPILLKILLGILHE